MTLVGDMNLDGGLPCSSDAVDWRRARTPARRSAPRSEAPGIARDGSVSMRFDTLVDVRPVIDPVASLALHLAAAPGPGPNNSRSHTGWSIWLQ